jgi:hypothetical protein
VKDRLATAAGALLALAAVYALLFQKSPQAPVSLPTSVEAGRNGYLAIDRWLTGAGVDVRSQQRRYDALVSDASLPARGNVLIATLPEAIPARVDEIRALSSWVRDGNTLLIMAALDDTPEWAAGGDGQRFMRNLTLMTGLSFVPVSSEVGSSSAPAPIEADSVLELTPVEAHPLMDSVRTLRGYSDGRSSVWNAAAPANGSSLLLRLAVEAASGIDAAWEVAAGRGRVIIVASGSLLTNHRVAVGDARAFLANVLRYHLAPGGAVIFDDMHQGLSSLYDPAAFFGDSRLHATLWFLLAGWLIYLLGSSNRWAPPRPVGDQPQQSDFVEAVGGFMARRLDRCAAGKLLFSEWFNELRKRRGLEENGEPLWDELDAAPMLGAHTREALESGYESLVNGRPVDLVRLHNVFREARKAIG